MTSIGDRSALGPSIREPSPRRRRRGRIVAAAGLVISLGVVVTVVVLWNRVTVHPVSMDAARERAGTASGPSTPLAPLVPAAGVYRYRGTGTEHLDRPPRTQRQGPDIPGTVSDLGGGCWRFRVDYSNKHWQSWDYCATATALTENAGSFFQRIELGPVSVDTSSTVTCDPPVDAIRLTQVVGDRSRQACHGTSTASDGEVTSTGPYTFVGEERLDIDGQQVTTLHYHRVRTLGGAQHGTEDVNTWFEATTGLPVRNSRVITVHSDSVLGTVTYTERGSFTLVSLTPTR